jgi:hypothetical protein
MSDSEEGPRYAYRAIPQLSANQMAEYLGSSTSSTRRTSIIREARFPKTSQVAQYDKAREGLVNFLTDGTRSYRHLADATDYLERREAKPDATEWVKRDSRGSIEAINAFQRSYNKLAIHKLDCRPVHGRQPHLDMWPTRISVAMNFTVHKPVPGGKDQIGGALLLFSKGESSTKTRIERSKTIAGLIYTFCNRFLMGMGDPDPTLCFAIDVFSGVAHTPQGTFTRKLRNVGDACDEIAARWKTIPPPSDYDGPDPS